MNIRQAAYERMARFTGSDYAPQTGRVILDAIRNDYYTTDGDVELILEQARLERAALRHDTFIKIARITGRAASAGTRLIKRSIPEVSEIASHAVISVTDAVSSVGDAAIGIIDRVTIPLTGWRETQQGNKELPQNLTTSE